MVLGTTFQPATSVAPTASTLGSLLDTSETETSKSSNVVDLLDDIGINFEDNQSSSDQASKKAIPPRPAIPPSKETKDLILSVTGAMEATSSDLLDRLQMTRTPSPTPIRDLHSPSPTPDVMQVLY